MLLPPAGRACSQGCQREQLRASCTCATDLATSIGGLQSYAPNVARPRSSGNTPHPVPASAVAARLSLFRGRTAPHGTACAAPARSYHAAVRSRPQHMVRDRCGQPPGSRWLATANLRAGDAGDAAASAAPQASGQAAPVDAAIAGTQASASAEQDVSDPSQAGDLGVRGEGATQPTTSASTARAIEPARREGEVGESIRGKTIVRKMKDWKEMAEWISEVDGDRSLFPTEISRMWTGLVEARPSSTDCPDWCFAIIGRHLQAAAARCSHRHLALLRAELCF